MKYNYSYQKVYNLKLFSSFHDNFLQCNPNIRSSATRTFFLVIHQPWYCWVTSATPDTQSMIYGFLFRPPLLMDHKLEEVISCKKSSFRLYTNFYFLFHSLINSGKIEYNYKLVCVMEANSFSFPGRMLLWSPGLRECICPTQCYINHCQNIEVGWGYSRQLPEMGTKDQYWKEWLWHKIMTPNQEPCGLMAFLTPHLQLFVSFLVSFLSIIVFSYFFSVASQTELIICSNMSDLYSNTFHCMGMLIFLYVFDSDR